jgi:hypothetical protein
MGICIDRREKVDEKVDAQLSIEVAEVGIVTEISLVQPSKAESGIEVVPGGNEITVSEAHSPEQLRQYEMVCLPKKSNKKIIIPLIVHSI